MGTSLASAALMVAGGLVDLGHLLRWCAYIDPGTGSFFIQVLIGVLFGGVLALKLGWKSVKAFLGRLFSRRKDDGNDHVQGERP